MNPLNKYQKNKYSNISNKNKNVFFKVQNVFKLLNNFYLAYIDI